jgi:hypothetical protein
LLERGLEAVNPALIEYFELGKDLGGEDCMSDAWRALLSRLVSVHTFYHNAFAPYSLLSSLAASGSSAAPPVHIPLFPSLQRLWIRELDLRHGVGLTPTNFEGMVHARVQLRVPLACLQIDRLVVDGLVDDRAALLQRLKQLVPLVECVEEDSPADGGPAKEEETGADESSDEEWM